MLLGNNSDRDWEKLAASNRYYWVTTFDKYRDREMTEERWQEFFEESSDSLGTLLQVISKHLDPEFKVRRVLDFGCGIGRVAIPLAEIAESVVGLDISENMLEEARRNCTKKKLENLSLCKSDDALSAATGTFNFIHSIYVLQHIPFVRGKAIVKRMLELLEENGVLAVQVLVSNDLPLLKKASYWIRVHVPLVRNVLNLLNRKPWDSPMMQLNSYPLNPLIDLLKSGGCNHLYLRHTKDGPYNGVFIFAQKKASVELTANLGDIP